MALIKIFPSLISINMMKKQCHINLAFRQDGHQVTYEKQEKTDKR